MIPSVNRLRKRVKKWNRFRRDRFDEPWGTSLAAVLERDEPDLLFMLADEDLDPTGYHAGSLRYEKAWGRLIAVITEELALIASEEARQAAVREYLWSEKVDPLDLSEDEEGLLPLPALSSNLDPLRVEVGGRVVEVGQRK